MRQRMLWIVAVGALWSAAPAAADDAGRYVVVFKAGARPSVSVLAGALHFTATFRYTSALHGFAARLSGDQLSALKANPAVDYVARDTTFTATGLVALSAGETLPAGIARVGAASAGLVHPSSGVSVAVLDSGIDLANQDLNAVSGVNCVKTGSPQDDNGHGTNVAGIIAARNQGSGVVGVAPGTKLYAVKVLNRQGSGTLSQILCGIDWVTANTVALNIKVANMSLAGAGQNDNNCGHTNNDAQHQAICGSVAAGVTYVAGAGNNSGGFGNYVPAAYPEVLTVTAMTDTDGLPGGVGPAPCVSGQKDDTYATYSNYGVSATDQAHAIAAPGTCVSSDAIGGGTTTYYGTSQATPHVAGAVALCVDDGGTAGACSGMSPAQIVAKLRADAAAGAVALGGFTGDPLHPIAGKYFGYLLDAAIY